MVKVVRAAVAVVALTVAAVASAGDFLFVSPPYLLATRDVIAEARDRAPEALKGDVELVGRFNAFADALEEKVDDVRRDQVLKKVKDDDITDREDAAFAAVLNDFKDGLAAMAETSGKKIEEILPSWDRWNRMETALVSQGLDKRLAAYRTRFGPESEPINLIEFVASQAFLAGDESGPSAWEPIARVSALQATTRGSGLTSTVQLGMNRYFLHRAPKPLRVIGVENHVGLAATLQYLDNEGILEIKGKPSFGVMLHLDRKEIGVAWDNDEDRLHLTIGYAFQFVPLVM